MADDVKAPENRMGTIETEEVLNFARQVVEAEGLDVKVDLSSASPSICLPGHILFRPDVAEQYPWQAYEEILHEVAHSTTHPVDKTHGSRFYARYVELLSAYMVGERNDG